ncbi:MAG: leucyl/phenylalanyl-tRNA--protein transferase [Gracilimonas sp.]|uniref:leucyl/phenylalanyl-tRNA--protein transferase n=1 Tax=Gracilimonas TaxID=649462 RepID=UPI001B09CD46|nr:leucyl/phenylalanyl-tRNA--protein transferase [Gracilimonas sp.]MBO6584814.1 leucyl/phenylalanyl-tRNA--protein transferase [Gracilimonas sp.]MBO6615915.1 leucyl/phenylalanyl-tRNA--protein transferase [Gracilimonas sp.]
MKIIPPESLVEAYSQGIFPMAEHKKAEDVNWYTARKRGVIPIGKFHTSDNLARIIRQGRFEVRVNENFRDVVKQCANRETSWINDLIINSYDVLNQYGNACSVEAYRDGELVGGLYGVKLKAAFFGESMFKKEKWADKAALYHCHEILNKNGFLLWDTQFYTDHLAQFGCIEIDAAEYEEILDRALNKECNFLL